MIEYLYNKKILRLSQVINFTHSTSDIIIFLVNHFHRHTLCKRGVLCKSSFGINSNYCLYKEVTIPSGMNVIYKTKTLIFAL